MLTLIVGTNRPNSNTRKVATVPAPACPKTYGCVPGTTVVPVSNFFPGVGNGSTVSTTISRNLWPGGRVKRERLNQLDLRVSKTFRVSKISILPTLEVGNLFNQDKIGSYASEIYATTTGSNYLVPNGVLQSRIIGFGAQVRW